MPLKFNGTNITRVFKDGVDINVLKFGNTEVFRKRKLTINFTGANNARYGTYPLVIRSASITPVSIYGANVTKEIYIPNGETVYIDLRNYIQYKNDNGNSFEAESVLFLEWSGRSFYVGLPSSDNINAFSFTMDKDIVLNPISGQHMGNLNQEREEGRYWSLVEFYANTTSTLTNPQAISL